MANTSLCVIMTYQKTNCAGNYLAHGACMPADVEEVHSSRAAHSKIRQYSSNPTSVVK